jgi:hypothetical protein
MHNIVLYRLDDGRVIPDDLLGFPGKDLAREHEISAGRNPDRDYFIVNRGYCFPLKYLEGLLT